MSKSYDILFDLEKMINESTENDNSSIQAGLSYLEDAKKNLADLKKDGVHKTKTTRKKDKITGTQNKNKKEEETEEEKTDDAEDVEKNITSDEKDNDEADGKDDVLDLGQASKYSKLIDMLNQFRAAKSFTGEDVAPQLKSWFERLTVSEKKVLHILIKGLIQITLTGETGDEATVPSDLGFKVVDGRISKEKKKRIKDEMSPSNDEEEIKSKEKESSIEPPVKIESKQNKKDILEAIKRNVL